MIAQESQFITVDQKDAREPEPGLEAVNRPIASEMGIQGNDPAVRGQPRQLLILGPTAQEPLDGESL